MGRTAKLTVSLPEELVSFADQVAREKKVSRSKVLASCLREMAERHKVSEMAEGYKAMAKEHTEMAALASETEHEVIPDWS